MQRANYTFLLISLTQLITTFAINFRYRKFGSTYYDNGEVLGTNYWKLANQISGYSSLVFWALAFVT